MRGSWSRSRGTLALAEDSHEWFFPAPAVSDWTPDREAAILCLIRLPGSAI